jgi:threonine dehydrogenase-like Zn-dependent dehydrogenase
MRGVDGVVDAVGFEAKGSTTETVLATLKLEGSSGKALRQCIAAVRRGGVVSVQGDSAIALPEGDGPALVLGT